MLIVNSWKTNHICTQQLGCIGFWELLVINKFREFAKTLKSGINTPNFVVSFLEVTAVVSKKQVLILLARECIIMSQPPKSASSLQTPYARGECIRCQFVPSPCVTSLSSNLDLSSSCQAASNQVVSCRSTGRRLMCAICKKEKNLETSTLPVEVASKVAHVGSSTKWWSDHGHPHQYLWITTMSTHDASSLRSKLINRLIIEYISVTSNTDPGVELLASSKIWSNLDFCSLIYNLELWVESVLRCQRSASSEPSSTLKQVTCTLRCFLINNQLTVTKIDYKC